MSEQTTEMAKSALRQANPLRRGMAWWVIGLEGLILFGIGIYLLQPSVGARVVLLLGLYLLIVSLERALNGFRERIPPAILAERMLRAGIGLTVGAIVVIDAWQPFMTSPAPLVILSLGWLLIGLVGVWEWVSARGELGLGLGGLIFPVISTVFGLLMLVSRTAMGPILLDTLAVVAIVSGIALLGYAYVVYRKRSAVVGGGESYAGAGVSYE